MESTRYILILGLISHDSIRLKGEIKHKHRHKVQHQSLQYENIFIPKPILRPKYGMFCEPQAFLMQGAHRDLFVVSDLPKQMDLLWDPMLLLNCDN